MGGGGGALLGPELLNGEDGSPWPQALRSHCEGHVGPGQGRGQLWPYSPAGKFSQAVPFTRGSGRQEKRLRVGTEGEVAGTEEKQEHFESGWANA